MPTFFLNGTTLLNSTAVFLDSEQLICAPDGYYSDGVIVREQLGCRLILTLGCPSCAFPCPADAGTVSAASTGAFLMSLNTGIGTGAIIVTFTPTNKPDGIIAEFNGSYYNEFSSSVFGYLPVIPNQPVFVGDSVYCACPTFATTGCTYTLPKYEWDGTAFVSSSGTETITVTSPQVLVALSSVGDCIMVIPKTSVASQTLNISAYITCVGSTFNLSVQCPQPLPSFQSSIKSNPSFPEFCGLPTTVNTFYVAKVDNSFPAPFVLVNDWVFQDENGQVKLEDGYYKTDYVIGTNNTIEVVNGVVVAVSFAPCD